MKLKFRHSIPELQFELILRRNLNVTKNSFALWPNIIYGRYNEINGIQTVQTLCLRYLNGQIIKVFTINKGIARPNSLRSVR